MEDKITLDRETFKALAVDTRVKILKILDERQHTLTDLAEELGMAPSTIKEHLDKLLSAGLIKQIDKGMKWKYYRLTWKGSRVVNPHETKVWIILTTTLVALSASVYTLLSQLEKLVTPIPGGMEGVNFAREDITKNISKGLRVISEVTTTIPPEITTITAKIPYAELFIVILLVLILGICVGYLMRRKRVI